MTNAFKRLMPLVGLKAVALVTIQPAYAATAAWAPTGWRYDCASNGAHSDVAERRQDPGCWR